MGEFDPTDLASQERTKADRKQREKLERDTEEADIKWLMGSKRGRRIVWRLLEQAGVYRSSFNPNSMTMAFSEGGRNGGLRLIAMIHAQCPELYPTMVREANERNNAGDGRGHNDN